MLFLFLILCAACMAPALAQPVAPSVPAAVPKQAAAPAPQQRMASSAQRNENVPIYQMDTNAIKEANIRLGDNVTMVPAAPAELSYFAAEHGRPPGEAIALRPAAAPAGWHGELFASHQNSVFNARTFFQVGAVKPSRRNNYGGRMTGGAGPLGWLTASFSQRKVRGMVNGNVLVPLANERQPTASDPARRAIIARWLSAYPDELPNRPDFDPRALNTNAPQRMDDVDGSLRLERNLGERTRIIASHAIVRQRVDAFQLVAGQNPDTEIHTHRSRLTVRRSLSAASEVAGGFGFTRVRSLLASEPDAVGPRVRMGFQIQELGPDSMFPVDRAQNSFRGGLTYSRQLAGGRHALTLGGDATRFQLNGIETNNQRPYIQFTNNFGRSALENFLAGAPSTYEVSVGEMARGFRSWSANAYLGDKWQVNSKLQVYLGMRYNLESAPVEVNNLNQIPYGCDCNNFGPRISIAWVPGASWTLRTSYALSFGQILPVTYQQIRYNLPLVRYIQVQNPDLLDPLRGVPESGGRSSPTVLSPDMVSPYIHHYNLAVERAIAGSSVLRLGYVGSRSIKLLNAYVQNRADPVPGIPLTAATVDLRRPDPRYYEIKRILNGGIAYLDAAQVSLELPARRGLGFTVSYTFGKALDSGTDYAFTAANNDLLTARSQWQYDSQVDKKGLSNFDSTHAVMLSYNYDLPDPAPGSRTLGWLVNGWHLGGVTVLKSGTPLTLYIGSDTPGFGNVDGGPSDRPNILDPSILGMTIGDPNTAPQILRRSRFAYITPGEHRGSVARGAFRKSPIANFNTALAKQWRWAGRREWLAVLRAEAYNLTNHPQFDEPQRNLSSPSFGRITNTLNDGRIFQLGLRLVM